MMPQPPSGAGIVNAKGVTGTLGCLAYTLHDGCPVLLSTWHVLFGEAAREDSAVWWVKESTDGSGLSGIGRTLYGKLGTVEFAGEDYYVDCAVASFHKSTTTSKSPTLITDYGTAQVGDVVRKSGAATGTTRGTIIDVTYSDPAVTKGRRTPRQLLVKSLHEEKVFSAEGDSGAIVVDAANKAVGLLWGTNISGQGIACPIAPVLYAMNITLEPRALLSR